MSTVLVSGRGNGGQFRETFIQPDSDHMVFVNGYDNNSYYFARTGVGAYLGITPPSIAVLVSQAAGLLNGSYRYRMRWASADTGAFSNPGPELAVTAALKQNVLSPAAGGVSGEYYSHYIIERTTNLGRTFYPINRDQANPFGTPITNVSNYTDNIPDDDNFFQRLVIGTWMGKPRPYKFGCANGGRLFLGGASVLISTGTTHAASAHVTGLTNVRANMVGQAVNFAGSFALTGYYVATVVSATEITLDRNFADTPGAYVTSICDIPNRGAWSEIDNVNHFGKATFTGLQNEAQIGDSEPLTAVVGMGTQSGSGAVLWCKRRQLHLHSYGATPNFTSGASITQLPVKRGALGARCVRFIDGRVYGIDEFGIWAYAGGGVPQEIGGALRGDWQNGKIDFTSGDLFWIQWRPENRTAAFYVVEGGGSQPTLAYILDVDRGTFVGCERYALSRLCGFEMAGPDGRHCAHSYADAAITGASYACAHGIGKSDGLAVAVAPVAAAITAIDGGSGALSVSTATWPTAGDGLKGVPVRVIKADGSFCDGYIIANTASQVTPAILSYSYGFGAPAIGDTVQIGGIPWRIRTGRYDLGAPMRKKRWAQGWIRLRKKTSASKVKVALFFDGQTTPNTDRLAINEDGRVQVTGGKIVAADGAAGWLRYPLPLNGIYGNDIQLEISGDGVGASPEILSPIQLSGDADGTMEARR